MSGVLQNAPELDNPRELIDLLMYVNQQCMQGEHYKNHMVLLSVDLGDLYYVGRNSNLLYYSHLGLATNLRGMFLREFLGKFWGKKPRVNVTGNIWVFDPIGSGPFPTRYTAVEDETLKSAILSAVDTFLRETEKVRKEHRKLVQEAGSDVPAWKLCPICGPIPDNTYNFWKGGNLETDGIPANENLLEILGAPLFDDSTSSGHWCVKRCPECGTCYKWDFSYEYLVNGSEDEVNLIRLSDVQAREWIQKVNDTIRLSTEDFKARAPLHLEALMAATNQKALKAAAEFIEYAQFVKGHDITFTIPALVYALARHPHTQSGLECPGYWIASILRSFTDKGPDRVNYLLTLMKAAEVTSVGDEFSKVIDDLSQKLVEDRFAL